MIQQPYTDGYLYYDENSNQYVLTQKAVLDAYGIDLAAEAVNPDNLTSVRAILKRVTTVVYAYIHSYNTANYTQNCMIAYTQEGRKMIYEALLEQFIYMRANGDMSLTDKTKAVAPLVPTILERKLYDFSKIGLGYSVLYSGTFPFCFKK